MQKIIFDTNAVKALFENDKFRDIFMSLPENKYLILAPRALEREWPTVEREILKFLDEEIYESYKQRVFRKIVFQEQSKVKPNLELAAEILSQFGHKVMNKQGKFRGDVEFVSFCIFHKPCFFVTAEGEEKGMLRSPDFVKHLLTYGVVVLSPEGFIKNAQPL